TPDQIHVQAERALVDLRARNAAVEQQDQAEQGKHGPEGPAQIEVHPVTKMRDSRPRPGRAPARRAAMAAATSGLWRPPCEASDRRRGRSAPPPSSAGAWRAR